MFVVLLVQQLIALEEICMPVYISQDMFEDLLSGIISLFYIFMVYIFQDM